MMMNSKPFSGTNVFMSRKLVPPELFDTLLDALKQNGAEVFLCCDPSRSKPSDFHVISSPEHEKFEDLRAKGCQMIGPQCVLSCAKERRALPMQGFTCCLAMDGVKILASGFEANEKEKITKLVTAMRGTVHIKASSDVNFVVAKNVLATKYKWALNISKKPIVSIDWIDQCWKEHRVVPQEQHKILPFSGLMICVTGIPSGERKSMEQLILQNGGKYSAELTKKCTHLISEAPDGDKYKVARRWGHIYIVTRKWFDQSIAQRACLNEESYPVQGAPVSSINAARASFSSQRSQDTTKKTSQSAFSSAVADSNQQAFPYSDLQVQDLEATLSQKVSFKVPDYSDFLKEDNGKHSEHPISELQVDGCVADDSQSEDNDLYLSECRIFLAGFGAPEMRKLVNTVRRGGGTRYMSINNGLTHIVIGDPSEIEKKKIRNLTASGVIKVVKANWLEDCDRLKKEIPVLQKHIGHDLLLPRGSLAGNNVFRQLNSSKTSNIHAEQNQDKSRPSSVTSFETEKRGSFETTRSDNNPFESTATAEKRSHVSSANEDKVLQKVVLDASNQSQQANSISTVFKGKRFSFSFSFPEERRAEIVQWISRGGGVMIDDKTEKSVDFTIECHGVIPKSSIATRTTFVSSHWVRCCFQDGQLLDVRSHILYSPLPCGVPLPDFKSIRFCTSQYDEKDRLLLKNLFFTLGARYSEKLTKKVTHLVCKFTNGAKYEAACRWGIQTVTLEWIHKCVQKNRVVPVDSFCPKEASTQELEAAKCSVSQYPTQAFQMLSGENPSQRTSQLRDNAKKPSQATTSASDHFSEEQVHLCKKARSSEDCGQNRPVSCPVQHKNSTDKDPITENETSQSACNVFHGTPEIADAIEVFLEETSKIHEVRSPERTKFDENQFASECQVIDQQQQQAKLSSAFGLSNQLRNRYERNDDLGHSVNSSLSVPAKDDSRSSPAKDDLLGNISGEVNANIYDGFSETQTESQIVGYEEDLSGRQMIIDRILARSSLT